MAKIEVAIFFSVGIASVMAQLQNFPVPQGAMVEFEVEFVNQQGQRATGAAGGGSGTGAMPITPQQMMPPPTMSMMSPMAGMQPEMMPPMSPMGMMSPIAGMQPGMIMPRMGMGMQMQPMMMGAPVSSIQRLLSNIMQVALRLRRMFRPRAPIPVMEEPCPCDAECCSLPSEPRRVLPVFDLPMTLHRGCCGCVECPISLSPVFANMIRNAQAMSGTSPGSQQPQVTGNQPATGAASGGSGMSGGGQAGAMRTPTAIAK